MGFGSHSGIYRELFDVSTATTTEVVAAVAGKRIVVTHLVISLASTQTVIWRSGSTDITGEIIESYVAADNELGIMETSVGEALNLVTSAAVDSNGHLTYVLLP